MSPFSHRLCQKSSCGHSCLYIVVRRKQNERTFTVPQCPPPELTAVLELGGAQVAGRVEVWVRPSSYRVMPSEELRISKYPVPTLTLTVCNIVSRERCFLSDTFLTLNRNHIKTIYVIGTLEPDSR